MDQLIDQRQPDRWAPSMHLNLTPTAKGATVFQVGNALFGEQVSAALHAPPWATIVAAVLAFLTPIAAAAFRAWLDALLAHKSRKERIEAAATAATAVLDDELAELKRRLERGELVIVEKPPAALPSGPNPAGESVTVNHSIEKPPAAKP
jgi:hypothetical protein